MTTYRSLQFSCSVIFYPLDVAQCAIAEGGVIVGFSLPWHTRMGGTPLAHQDCKIAMTFPQSSSQIRAHAIMGMNYFGINEAIAHFGFNPHVLQRAFLDDVTFTDEVLEARKNTHVLAVVVPISIMDLRDRASSYGLFREEDWYCKEIFANDKGGSGWRLISKTPVPNSVSETWHKQKSLLGMGERIPPVRAVLYTMIGHFLATGVRLFREVSVCCCDLDWQGRHVTVGNFNSTGLSIGTSDDSYQSAKLGLSVEQKI